MDSHDHGCHFGSRYFDWSCQFLIPPSQPCDGIGSILREEGNRSWCLTSNFQWIRGWSQPQVCVSLWPGLIWPGPLIWTLFHLYSSHPISHPRSRDGKRFARDCSAGWGIPHPGKEFWLDNIYVYIYLWDMSEACESYSTLWALGLEPCHTSNSTLTDQWFKWQIFWRYKWLVPISALMSTCAGHFCRVDQLDLYHWWRATHHRKLRWWCDAIDELLLWGFALHLHLWIGHLLVRHASNPVDVATSPQPAGQLFRHDRIDLCFCLGSNLCQRCVFEDAPSRCRVCSKPGIGLWRKAPLGCEPCWHWNRIPSMGHCICHCPCHRLCGLGILGPKLDFGDCESPIQWFEEGPRLPFGPLCAWCHHFARLRCAWLAFVSGFHGPKHHPCHSVRLFGDFWKWTGTGTAKTSFCHYFVGTPWIEMPSSQQLEHVGVYFEKHDQCWNTRLSRKSVPGFLVEIAADGVKMCLKHPQTCWLLGRILSPPCMERQPIQNWGDLLDDLRGEAAAQRGAQGAGEGGGTACHELLDSRSDSWAKPTVGTILLGADKVVLKWENDRTCNNSTEKTSLGVLDIVSVNIVNFFALPWDQGGSRLFFWGLDWHSSWLPCWSFCQGQFFKASSSTWELQLWQETASLTDSSCGWFGSPRTTPSTNTSRSCQWSVCTFTPLCSWFAWAFCMAWKPSKRLLWCFLSSWLPWPLSARWGC